MGIPEVKAERENMIGDIILFEGGDSLQGNYSLRTYCFTESRNVTKQQCRVEMLL